MLGLSDSQQSRGPRQEMGALEVLENRRVCIWLWQPQMSQDKRTIMSWACNLNQWSGEARSLRQNLVLEAIRLYDPKLVYK